MKKVLLNLLPFAFSLSIGACFYYFPVEDINLKNMTISLSSTLIGITLTYLCYNVIKSFSEKKLKKTLIEYAKVKIDEEILSCIFQLQKMIYPLDTIDKSFLGITNFINISKSSLIESATSNQLLGFQIFKDWNISLKNIEKILENNYILKYMEDDQIIVIVELLRNINFINNIKEAEGLFKQTNKKANDYKILPPDLKQEFPNRSILLKKINGQPDKGIVVDFGEIPKYNFDKALHIYKINEIEFFATAIYDFLEIVRNWINCSGKEILIFSKNYRLVKKNN